MFSVSDARTKFGPYHLFLLFVNHKTLWYLNNFHKNMGSKNNNPANKISLQSNNRGGWDTLDEILKQGTDCDDIVVELNEGERKPLITNLQTNCDNILNSTTVKPISEFPDILLENNQRYSIEKGPAVADSIKKEQCIESEGEMCHTKLGTSEKLFVNSKRDSLGELQKQKHHNEKQSASDSSKQELKKVFERRLDVHSGKLVFKCLFCEFQSIPFENMMRHINNNTHKTGSETGQPNTYEKIKTQKRLCGLCLEACDSFKAIEGDMKVVLDTVLPNLDSATIQGRVVCTHCTKTLTKCFDFKTACLYTYNYIVSFVNNKDNVKLNLKDIYLSKNENGTSIPEDEVICGFCMNPVKYCSAISLDVEEGDVTLEIKMAQCLPELDLSLIEKPVVCASCYDSLENCFGFMTSRLAVEEKIQKYRENLNVNDKGQIELSSLLRFTRDKTTNGVNGSLVDMIKEEKPICEEVENADDRKIDNERDIFKSEPIFFVNSEEESKKLEEIYLKEENLFEMDNEQIDGKLNEQDFNRFDGGKPEDTELSKKKVTMYKCDSCSFQSRLKANFRRHLLQHKDPSEIIMYKCDYCSFQSKQKIGLKQHLLVHTDPSETVMYSCASCSFQTKYKSYIKKHLLNHKNPSEVTMYKCDSCSFQSKHKSILKAHVLIHKSPSEVTMYNCDTCSYQTKHKRNLMAHVMRHKRQAYPSETVIYNCPSCSFQTKHKSYIKKHLLNHKNPSEVTMYKCDSCSFQSKHKSILKAHQVVHKSPSETTMYNCDVCLYQTKHRGNLIPHILRHKGQAEPSEAVMYNCACCSFQTKYKSALRRHLLLHKDLSEITMYKCDFCSFQTKQKSILKSHVLIHKSPSEVTMYNCDTCSYQTKHKRNLISHVFRHKRRATRYKCEFCSYQALTKSDFKRHVLTHETPSEEVTQ